MPIYSVYVPSKIHIRTQHFIHQTQLKFNTIFSLHQSFSCNYFFNLNCHILKLKPSSLSPMHKVKQLKSRSINHHNSFKHQNTHYSNNLMRNSDFPANVITTTMEAYPVHKWLLDAIMVVGDEDRSPATASFDESSLAEADQDDEKYKVERSKVDLI